MLKIGSIKAKREFYYKGLLFVVMINNWLYFPFLQVQEGSPGYKAGLEPFFDFIVMVENIRLVSIIMPLRLPKIFLLKSFHAPMHYCSIVSVQKIHCSYHIFVPAPVVSWQWPPKDLVETVRTLQAFTREGLCTIPSCFVSKISMLKGCVHTGTMQIVSFHFRSKNAFKKWNGMELFCFVPMWITGPDNRTIHFFLEQLYYC